MSILHLQCHVQGCFSNTATRATQATCRGPHSHPSHSGSLQGTLPDLFPALAGCWAYGHPEIVDSSCQSSILVWDCPGDSSLSSRCLCLSVYVCLSLEGDNPTTWKSQFSFHWINPEGLVESTFTCLAVSWMVNFLFLEDMSLWVRPMPLTSTKRVPRSKTEVTFGILEHWKPYLC